jgi:hypothetical protein
MLWLPWLTCPCTEDLDLASLLDNVVHVLKTQVVANIVIKDHVLRIHVLDNLV